MKSTRVTQKPWESQWQLYPWGNLNKLLVWTSLGPCRPAAETLLLLWKFWSLSCWCSAPIIWLFVVPVPAVPSLLPHATCYRIPSTYCVRVNQMSLTKNWVHSSFKNWKMSWKTNHDFYCFLNESERTGSARNIKHTRPCLYNTANIYIDYTMKPMHF